jgi:hypothetical protein
MNNQCLEGFGGGEDGPVCQTIPSNSNGCSLPVKHPRESSFTTTWCVPTPHHFNNVMYIEHFDTLLAWLPGVKRRSLQRSLSLAATVSS